MLSIETMLNLVKENHEIKSDRQLAKVLGVKNMGDYRKENGSVFSDEIALKIAQMSGLKPELVLASCKGATAKKKADVESQKVWERIYKTALGSASISLLITTILMYPATVKASPTLSTISQQTIYYATLYVFDAS